MIRIVDFAVFQRIESAHTVLGDKERKMVTIVVAGKRHAQTQRIDLPLPGSLFILEVRIAQRREHVALRLLGDHLIIGAHQARAIVRERDEVDRMLCQILRIARLKGHVNTLFLECTQLPSRIGARSHHVCVEVAAAVLLIRKPYVLGRTTVRIGRTGSDHATHLVCGIDLVQNLDSASARHKHMVRERRGHGCTVTLILERDTRVEIGQRHAVDLVERKPITHEALVRASDGLDVVRIPLDHLSALPATIALDQSQRIVVVRQRHKRLDSMLAQRLEYLTVKLQALAVGLGLHPCGKNTAPAN